MDWTNYATGCVHSMKKSNDLDGMNPEDFERQLQRQPLRPVPAAWRADILKAADAASSVPYTPRPDPSFLSTLNSQLSALLWPCPKAWAGLAAVWLVIFAVNYASEDKSEIVMAKSPPPTPQMMMALQEQRKMLAKLIEPYDESPAEPPKPFVPRPRGELRVAISMA
jgi:hypothetical protein